MRQQSNESLCGLFCVQEIAAKHNLTQLTPLLFEFLNESLPRLFFFCCLILLISHITRWQCWCTVLNMSYYSELMASRHLLSLVIILSFSIAELLANGDISVAE